MRADEILSCVKALSVAGNPDGELTDVCTDSRCAKRGCVYIALRGARADGNKYIGEAIRLGAAVAVYEGDLPAGINSSSCALIKVESARRAASTISARFYGEPTRKIKIIGVTGTNGKTTVANLLCHIINRAGGKAGVIGTLGVSFCGRSMPNKLTTPDPVYMNYILAQMAESGVEYCVMECSAHALYYDKECSIEYEACIFTNLTQDHLDFFKDMEEYGRAKAKLFMERKARHRIINSDDEFGFKLARGIEGALTYGIENPSDAFAIIEESDSFGTELVINICDELVYARIGLIGKFNAYNALAAAACAYKLGFTCDEISAGLQSFKGVKGRLERAATYNGAQIFIDFAHTPDSLRSALITLRGICGGSLYVVFGCGGDRDEKKRPIMGKIATELADCAIITTDNPRTEEPFEIMRQIEAGAKGNGYALIERREEAIAHGIKMLKEGDILLIAGKGAEEYQEIMNVRYPYSDYEAIKNIIG